MRDRLRLAHSLVDSQQYAKAFKLVSDLLDENPDSPECLFLAGATLRGLDSCGMALPLLAKALSKRPDQPNLWMQYGATLHDLSRWEDAFEAFGRAGKIIPGDPMPIANQAATYVQRGKWRDGLELAERALAAQPDNHIANITKGFACMALGRWREAWDHAEYLYGDHLVLRIYNDAEHEEPMWDGTKGLTVVVTCDQGVGDIIMLSQCLPQMQADCKQVIVECSERLAPIIERNFPGTIVYGTIKDLTLDWPREHQIDAHIHMSRLGRIYRNAESDFPRRAYITPEPLLLESWRKWLERFPRPWVGLAWQGGIQKTQRHIRSMTLADYAPVMEQGGTFFDLSYHDSAAEVAAWNIEGGVQVIRPPIGTRFYDDTVAFVAALDEVFTVTTTIAHVCGALGKRAAVIVPAVPTWRYAYRCGDGMIWYPPDSVRLFRRVEGEQDWSYVIKRAAREFALANKGIERLCA